VKALTDRLVRIAVCTVLVIALLGDVLIARQMMHNQNEFYFSGPLGAVIAIALAVALVPASTRMYVTAAGVALFAWLGAAATGPMVAGCDPVMRPFIVPMVLFLFSAPLVASGGVFGAVPLAIGAGWLASRKLPEPTARTYVFIGATAVVITIASFAIAFMLGARPTPTACVL
jgi:hypothetical protein